MNRATLGALLTLALGAAPARAQESAPAAAVDPGTVTADDQGEVTVTEESGFTPAAGTETAPPLVIMGYVDVGFADVEGNGSSFVPSDPRLPVDYGVDPFAPAVNTRGDVASTDAGGLFANGFLPRSMGIGGRPSFFLNTVNFDVRYQPAHAPVMVFTRLHVLPRYGGPRGNDTSLYLEQAFGRVTPFSGREFFVSVGKFDSVFGIEYLENQSNFRTNITPSLFARYTTGTSVGAKAFYRQQLAPLWSALSLNVSATNSGNWTESLKTPDVSLTGRPVLAARLGYELNLPFVQVKLGGSGLVGPRNDQATTDARNTMWAADARLYAFGVSFSGEYVHVDEEEGAVGKATGLGEFPLSSAFQAQGFWAMLAYTLRLDLGPLDAVTAYYRYERRTASFEGFRELEVDRVTAGGRLDLWSAVIVKAEVLFNGERRGAPMVNNDVLAFSAVYSW